MKKIDEYLKEIQQKDECTSSAAGIGFSIDSPSGILKKQYPKKKYDIAILPDDKKKKNKKREILIDEQTNKIRHRVMIDFDGVIHQYDGIWNNGEMGKKINNIKESIDNIRNTYNNVDIVIFTTRACKAEAHHNYENQMKKLNKFLKENNIYYDEITGEKLGALIYIDDNGYRFTNWKNDLPKIKEIINKRIEERENRIK